ncbi:AmpG family muropeptide MFS transporter [Curvivirga aplysinae]|uniref:AmpG family muropeptide MFS transporter n=1 Tax=Curvivirga aplysinae TaxID=2529852 RepID=UPI0012BC97E6|nr:MFS transporter [Curvivirga aplysinae]
MSHPIEKQNSWRDAFQVYLSRPAITMFFLGYSSGLPILLVFSTLSIWLREVEISRADIGFFSWIALAYGFKFVWAPLIDAVKLPVLCNLLGRRRGWLFFAQCLVILAICGIAFNDAAIDATTTAMMAAALAFAGATQDIVIDAYRIERADESYQGAMAATYTAGYRIAMILAGAGALEIAGLLDVVEGDGLAGYDYNAWKWAYLSMAFAMGIGIIATLVIKEPDQPEQQEADPWLSEIEHKVEETQNPALKPFFWIFHHFIWPIIDFVQRYRMIAIVILALIATYRISDIVMGVMANVFYTDLGFAKEEIGRFSKVFGLIVTIGGTFLGGLLIRRYGVLKILLIGAILAAGSNLLFAYMAYIQSSNLTTLALVISADNLSAGIASAAFIAYLSSLVNKQFSASQYALYTSIMVILPKFLGGFSGIVVDASSWEVFFIGTALIGIPVIFLILAVEKLTNK